MPYNNALGMRCVRHQKVKNRVNKKNQLKQKERAKFGSNNSGIFLLSSHLYSFVNLIKFDQCLFIINSSFVSRHLYRGLCHLFFLFAANRRMLLIIPFLMCLLLYPGFDVSAYKNNKNVLIIRNICFSRGRRRVLMFREQKNNKKNLFILPQNFFVSNFFSGATIAVNKYDALVMMMQLKISMEK